MTDRIEPTAEDLEIARRNVRRLLRWDADRRKAMTPAEVLEEGTRFVGVVRRMTGDYLEFGGPYVEHEANLPDHLKLTEFT